MQHPRTRNPSRRHGAAWLLALCVSLFACRLSEAAAAARDRAVDAYNIRLGTQTFGPRYQFTTNSALVETADAIEAMGSDVVKFYLGKGFTRQYPGSRLGSSITNLVRLVTEEPSCVRVLERPFRHYVLWTYAFAADGDAGWSDGYSDRERAGEYEEIYALTRHLLTRYQGTGKQFYLGHWEGDWYLLPQYNTATNPSPTAIRGMIDWLNTRQAAVDDAVRDTPHSAVAVYHYTEVNRVRDALRHPATSNQRLVNAVLPHVPNLDFVSWSAYDGMDLDAPELHATLNYIESNLSTNKARQIIGRRVWVGEYGWGGSRTPADQEPLTRAFVQRLLPWSPRFILFWEMYDNEGKDYCLVDREGRRTPCYAFHERFANLARVQAARFQEAQGRLPSDAEFSALVGPALDAPLPPPTPLAVEQQSWAGLSNGLACVEALVSRGVYGDPPAVVRAFWGPIDGGTNGAAWANHQVLGAHEGYSPGRFRAVLTGLAPGAAGYCRFQASNTTAVAWAKQTLPLPARSGDPAGPGGVTGVEPLTVNVIAIHFDPVLKSRQHQKLHAFMRGSDPQALTERMVEDARSTSGGFVNYRVVDRIEYDGFPVFRDGFTYTEEAFLRMWETNREAANQGMTSFKWLFEKFDLAARIRSQDVREIWLWGAPYMQWDELHWKIPGDRIPYPTENPWFYRPYDIPELGRTLWIMGWNYERGEGEMLESYCHRIESVLSLTVGRGVWDPRRGDNPWCRFTRVDKDFPGEAEVGSVHSAPNSVSDYDWSNTNAVWTYADDWLTYPELPRHKRKLDAASGGWDGIVNHHLWWMRHLPHAAGTTDGFYNNWWQYIVNYDQAIRELPPPGATFQKASHAMYAE